MFYTSSEWPSEVSSGHQCSSGAAAALHEFGVAAAARCVVRRVEPLVPTAAAHSRRRRPIALPLDLPLDLPHGHQRDDLLPLRGATARLRAERMRGGLSRNQSQSVAINRNQPQSAAISRNQCCKPARPSVANSRKQYQSAAISRNQSQSVYSLKHCGIGGRVAAGALRWARCGGRVAHLASRARRFSYTCFSRSSFSNSCASSFCRLARCSCSSASSRNRPSSLPNTPVPVGGHRSQSVSISGS